ncbi:capsular polysaccharide biosynthesis protein [Weizmannia acidilactici]|jgi:capsular polysaccharide biosynthesis protein|uniref:Capsular polysaccharide biosynthesis protein n=1 Tax=Weizmannia acidilactici TaxID=2607726 RepID=A0A5J4J622_9BACI|nr:Wzz/FepE/Etk N-terminal domain-containing protein [Weizmannia acidilactici]GER67968.1 capsular polysaccharide biosynthesis protein [Weizmannia acidilactici]GER70392.1 capsular polysaccharide biosynthesis protein [Weizmannia acidilactici]GER74426.1 capsular polysaccharide biosynthesis protein [Weizmannia acidilactici]
MEETISLKELMQVLRKRLSMIALVTLGAMIVTAVVTYFVITPVYESSTQILVNKASDDQSMYTTNAVQTNVQLVNTYNVIIKSPAILDKVIDELNLKMTSDELNSKITVSSEQNSQVFTLTVRDTNPYMAAKIANKIGNVFKSEIKKIMKVDNVTIISKAQVAEKPVQPKPLLNIAIALVVGLMIGIGIAFLLEYLDNTIKDEQDIEQILELPVLGVIGQIDDQELNTATRAGKKTKGKVETVGA